jgi:hypothetical protein
MTLITAQVLTSSNFEVQNMRQHELKASFRKWQTDELLDGRMVG